MEWVVDRHTYFLEATAELNMNSVHRRHTIKAKFNACFAFNLET